MSKPDVEVMRDLLARVKAAKGPDREIDGRLYCWHKSYRFLRVTTEDEYSPYRDIEPGPQYKGKGSLVSIGTLLFVDPNPILLPGGTRSYQFQQFASGWTRYSASIDAAVGLVGWALPGWHWHACSDGYREKLGGGACVFHGKDDFASGDAATTPLAICAALLTALIAAEDRHG